MRLGYSVLIIAGLLAVTILVAGCTQTSQPAAVITTAPPTTVETPTAVQTVSACGIENCHGLTVQCGPNVASACSTGDIDPGDRCRKYATCQVVSGTCQLVKETKFDKCVSCVQLCQNTYYNDPNMLVDCSDRCV